MSIERLPDQELKFLAGAPVIYHCHHFNLFLDQTIGDALGGAAKDLRKRAGRRAAGELLRGLFQAGQTPVERLQIAQQVFAAMGHGKLNFQVHDGGGEVHSPTLHYGTSWKEKYGAVIRRHDGADDFAAGFAAAATALAYGKRADTLEADEVACVSMRDPECRFKVGASSTPQKELAPVSRASVTDFLRAPMSGHREAEVQEITDGLNAFLAGVKPDERGLVQAFGVYVTLHLSNYYNQISFDALEKLSAEDPEMLPQFEDLLRESGHVCVFNTFGGILASPEWEGLVGKPSGNPEDIVVYCTAIARSLGFGRWSIDHFAPSDALRMKTAVNYENPYFQLRHGFANNAPEFFFQGATAAIMQLAHKVDWTGRPIFDDNLYQQLFVNDELPWSVEQTASLSLGDASSVVEVKKR